MKFKHQKSAERKVKKQVRMKVMNGNGCILDRYFCVCKNILKRKNNTIKLNYKAIFEICCIFIQKNKFKILIFVVRFL